MSTRWYPIYQRGNPQLRVFLPNFWMKIVPPEWKQPSNVVTFHCSMEMTVHDMQQYLEKIYNVFPVQVRSRIAMGKTKPIKPQNFIGKEDDVKVAYVVLPKNQSFEYPQLIKEEKEEAADEQLAEMKEDFRKFTSRNSMPGAPGWFRTH